MPAQNPLNQVERFHLECYTSGHIWLGQHHQHRSCTPIRIIQPRRQIQSWLVMFQRPTSSLSAVLLKMDIFPILPGDALVDDLEPPGLITSLPILACLWLIHFLWHKIVCSGGQSLRPQRLRVPDWLKDWLTMLTSNNNINIGSSSKHGVIYCGISYCTCITCGLSADRCYLNDRHCDNGWCLLTKYPCMRSRCPLKGLFWCDGYYDCPDRSDEAHCNITTVSTTTVPSTYVMSILTRLATANRSHVSVRITKILARTGAWFTL